MIPFTEVSSVALPLFISDIDTDVIIPIERLTSLPRERLGEFALEPLRFKPDGRPNESFPLNDLRYQHASILIAGPNFGCGSSREHAVWALQGLGIRAVIAPSFGSIFYNNCLQNGVLPVQLAAADSENLARLAGEGQMVRVSLVDKVVSCQSKSYPFDMEELRRQALIRGLDDIGLTLELREDILAWQARDATERPWQYLSTS